MTTTDELDLWSLQMGMATAEGRMSRSSYMVTMTKFRESRDIGYAVRKNLAALIGNKERKEKRNDVLVLSNVDVSKEEERYINIILNFYEIRIFER